MAVIQNDQKYSIQVVYKAAYDESGSLGLPDYSQTFNKVSESATPEQLRNFAIALMNLTKYYNAPYIIKMIDTSELIVE